MSKVITLLKTLDMFQSLWYSVVLQGRGSVMGKRRASGEGLLRWRKDRKCWEGRITVGTNEKGKPITKCFSGKTQRDVIAQMSQYREQLRGICLSSDSRMKLKDWGEKWLNEHMVHLIRPSTLKRYRRQCEIHIYPYLGDCQISKITTKQIQRMYNDLKENGRQINVKQKGKSLTGNTVRGIHTILHEMMEYALKENMIFNNPTNGTTIPKIEPFELQIVTDKQIKKFMAAIQSESDWRDFFYLEIMSGLRRGEICGLKWSDFDMVERKLNINRSISPEGLVGNTKTHYSVRSIKLPHSVYQILADRKETSRSDWIFPHPKDPTKPITGSIALRRLRKILSQADLPRIRFHDLRHTFATQAVSAGIDPKTLSSILGHSKASFSLDRYGHVTADMQKGAAKTMGAFFGELIGEEVKTWEKTGENRPDKKMEDGD